MEHRTRNNKVDVKFSDEEIDILEELEFETGLSRSGVIREAVKNYYIAMGGKLYEP